MKSFYSRDMYYRCLLYNGVAAKLLSLKPRTSSFFPLHGRTTSLVQLYDVTMEIVTFCYSPTKTIPY